MPVELKTTEWRPRAVKNGSVTTAESEPIGDPFAKLPAPLMPKDILPPIIEAFADWQARNKGVATHGPASAALTVCAAAIPDHVRIKVKVHELWHESARLWTALIGPPSAKKSPVLRAAMAPLKKFEKQEYARWAQAIVEWKKEDKDTRGPEPILRQYVLNDSTIEATGVVSAENEQGLLLERDELAGWFGAMDKYSSSRGAAADRAFWLQAWNGGPHKVNRISRPSIYIPNLSFSIIGGIQPDTMRRFAVDTVDDGLLQRLLPISVGSAEVGEDAPDTGDFYKNYEALVVRLTQLPETVVTFQAGAQTIRRQFERYAHELVRLEALSPQFSAFCGKLDGLFARLALIFHCCDSINLKILVEAQTIPEHIPEATAERVQQLMCAFIIPHAMRFYLEVAGETAAMADAKSIAGYILAKKVNRLTFGILTRDCRACRGKTREEVIRMLEPLEIFGWLEPDDLFRPRAWVVNSTVHEMFAERAEQERERRNKIRDLLKDMKE